MEYKTAQSKLHILNGRLQYLLLISIGLLVSNIFLVFLVGRSFFHEKAVIVPAGFNQTFTVSDSSVDMSYLRQMTLFFIGERLNITPTNVEHNHQVILQHTDSRFYHNFVSILGKEKEEIVKQNISSVFYPEEIMPHSKELYVIVKGSLVHWVGNSVLEPVKKVYLIKFSYRSGNLKVLGFSEVKNNEEI